jgi:arylsulfatase A-like enzyme
VDGSVKWLHKRTIDARSPSDREWIWAEVAIPAGTSAIVLQTRARRRRVAYAWAGWADPTFEPTGAPTAVARPRRPSHPSVIMITSDACRADSLGCYGAATDDTPNLDALAAEGLLFSDARANSSTTTGSYATSLTGRYPPVHGMMAEWGTLNDQLPNLVTIANRGGYRTVFAASEHDLSDPAQGFGRDFTDVIGCRANPSQDGSVTTRAFLRWLDERPDQPFLAWVSYYDTHPPLRLPLRASQAFYDGDPRDPSHEYRPDAVAAVHGVESLLEFETFLPLLKAGKVSGHLYHRLRDAARALAGKIASGPDLTSHVAALDADARMGLSVPEFAGWLEAQADRMAEGVIEPALIEWIDTMVPRLAEIEREILAGLRGVVDFRYVLAQARAAVAHLDDQVGALVQRLKDEDLYEDCTILFMSGHGELYGEGGEYGHHQSPLEPVLHTPLIVKPARSSQIAPGHVTGSFESVDLLPTLLELLDLPAPDTDGASRMRSIRGSRHVPERDTYAIDSHGLTATVRRGPNKLVLSRTWTIIEGEQVAPETARLFRLDGNVETRQDDPDIARDLDASLRQWMGAVGMPPALG